MPTGLTTTGPLVSVLLPVCETPQRLLCQAIASVTGQTYRDWELCVADDASQAPHVGTVLGRNADPRVRIVRLPERSGIAACTNAALQLARGDFVALLDHDDALAPHALSRVATELAQHPDAELVFSDEDKIVDGRRCCPYFKPGWDPELMAGQNIVSHLGVYDRKRLLSIGGLRAGFEGSQDYDLALRFAAASGDSRIRHIPDVLYHWRQWPTSFSRTQAGRSADAARNALSDARPGASVQPDPVLPQWTRIVHPLPDPTPLVSIIVPDGAAAPVDADYATVERVRGTAGEAAERSNGAVLLFLAPGLRGGAPGWLRELASQALRPEVGAVGGRLDRPDGRIAQAGFVLDQERIAQTLSPRSDRDDPGYFGQFRLPRSVSALSGDCLAIRRALFFDVGGFDPACGPYADVDLCLRLATRGLRCVWTPHARLGYARLPRAVRDVEAARLMRARWGAVLASDPYLNPNLMVRRGNLVLRKRPDTPSRIPQS